MFLVAPTEPPGLRRALVLEGRLRWSASGTLASACALLTREQLRASPELGPRPGDPPGTRAWSVHLLQSFPLVGPTVAGAIHDHFDGVPLAWTRGRSALGAVRASDRSEPPLCAMPSPDLSARGRRRCRREPCP